MEGRLERPSHGKNRGRAARTLGRGQTRRTAGLARSPPPRARRAQALGRQEHRRLTNCAVTGAIHPPSMSPYLPVTADQIAEAAIGAAEAGAAIVHLHARDEQTGRPDQTPEAFARFLQRIKQSTNAVINLTTGGAPFMTVQERVKPAETFKPEVASLNMGSMNFGLFPMLNRFKTFEHDWEAQA